MLRRRTWPEVYKLWRDWLFDDEVLARVGTIIDDVRRRGDTALTEYTEKYDQVRLGPGAFRVSQETMANAHRELDSDLKQAIDLAAERIRSYHQRLMPTGIDDVHDGQGAVTGQRIRPLRRVGIYVPGGRAPLFSTVLMTAVPARVAGVEEIAMATPCDRTGRVRPEMLYAASCAGVQEIYRIGGSQAIAALAVGTPSVPQVDKIVGPGNVYVTAAKKLLYGEVDIDMLAGPSEVVIVADRSAEPKRLAADLMAQAEHDPMAGALLIAVGDTLLDAVDLEIERLLPKMPREPIIESSLWERGGVVIAESMADAISMADQLAPEHLELAIEDPETWLPSIRRAGAVFLGHMSPETLGDYLAGPSHVLPTGGTARFASPLGVETFLRRMSVIGGQPHRALFQAASRMARAEGLEAHAVAADLRCEEAES